MGPKGTKKVSDYLVTLYDLKDAEHTNLYALCQQEKTRSILSKIYKSFDHKPMKQFVKENAIQVLQSASRVMTEGKIVDSFYKDLFYHTFYELCKICKQDIENGRMYLQARNLVELLKKNQQCQEEICNQLMTAKARLEVLVHTSKNLVYLKKIAHYIVALEHAQETQNYTQMQEETRYANAIFYQATRSSYYKKRNQ